MSLDELKTRINFLGGKSQQNRMNQGKLESLRKALLYSYQAATAILPSGKEFRCLINANKLSVDLDNKILSIPFIDICLNENSTEAIKTDIKEGDVIEWKENGSHWIVYLQHLEETAYFRAELRRCRYQVLLENGSKYWAYVRGPAEQNIIWSQTNGNYINQLNNTLQIYITHNKETESYFSRFSKIMLQGKPWEVQAIDSISTPGIIEIYLKEDFSNTPKTNIEKAVQDSVNIIKIQESDTQEPYIYGPASVDPYGSYSYEIKNLTAQGEWEVKNMSRNNAVKIINSNFTSIDIQIMTGKRGTFELIYKYDQDKVVFLPIEIGSL